MKALEKVDTVLFDLDDTLILEYQSAEDSFIETIKLLDSPIDTDDFLQTIRKQAREEWYKLPTIDYSKRIGISSWEALWADFTGDHDQLKKLRELAPGYRFRTWNKTLLKFRITDEKIAEKLSLEFKRIRNTKHILFPETRDVLMKLKNRYKLGLITNGTPDLQWKKIHGGKLEPYFDFIAISGEHGYAKPDSRLFESALRELKSTTESAMMVGDTLTSDIKGGKDAGIITVWVNRNKSEPDDTRPDYEVKSLSEVLQLFLLKL